MSIPKIDKDIPIPRRAFSKWAATVEEMKYGDSVVVHSRSIATALHVAINRGGHGGVVRKIAPDSYRVWKVPRKPSE